jgi:ACS family hexuronate transporter-like MFS transporter
MLFAATTINYMDRQVLALLKPTLMLSVANHGIGLTEESYGTVVSFFTLFYAIGQLGAGRFVDKIGTRIGYMVIMAAWSVSAMGHALVNSVHQATSPPPTRQTPSGSRRRSVRSLSESSTAAPMWA